MTRVCKAGAEGTSVTSLPRSDLRRGGPGLAVNCDV
jgi:hypothetical protein